MKIKFPPLFAGAFFLIGCVSDPIGGGGDDDGNSESLITPSGYQYSHITSKYNSYKTHFLKTSGSYSYILATGTGPSGNGITISEAHGYGMIIFALMDDKTTFDRMNAFRKAHPSRNGNGLMAWYIANVGQVPHDGNNATDGDLDIAYALLLAHKKWGGDVYLAEAKTLIAAIKQNNMRTNNYRTKLGDWDNSSDNTRSSDWMPGHFRAFAKATNDNFWNQAADMVYTLFGQVANSNTGLVPDFVTGNPARPDPNAGNTGEENAEHYSYNACRVPWRIAADYAHYKTPAAKTRIDKISSWLKGAANGSVRNIYSGYYLTGGVLPKCNYNDLAFVAPFAAGMIANSDNQTFLNSAYKWIRSESQNDDAYGSAIQLLCMLLITGNWQSPN